MATNRVNRGGSWNNNARNCRAANRNRNTPDNRNNNLGFRVAAAPPVGMDFPAAGTGPLPVPDGFRPCGRIQRRRRTLVGRNGWRSRPKVAGAAECGL